MYMDRGGNCLQLATAEAIDQRSITGFYAKPTNYTNVGVSVGWGARIPIERQQVIASPQSSKKDGRATDSCSP